MQAKPLGAYRRVSRQGEREDDRFRSPDFQAEVLDRWAAANGETLRQFECEVDVSGSRASRPILDELIRQVETGELAGIVVAKLDRLSRLAPRDRVELFERIERAGGVILSASEDLDASTPAGRFVREVFLGVARMQWEQKAEDFATAKANAIALGIPIKPRTPFGYRVGERQAGERRVRFLEPVAGERELVVELFERRAAGASRGELLELFERKSGRSSYKQTIAYMLKNRVYLGELEYGRSKRAEGELELVNAEAHEAIVDVELFEAVQKVDRARSTGAGSGGRPKALLAGIAYCAGCGRGLVCSRTGGARGVKPLSYKCPQDARKCTARASIGAAELDRYVEEEVLAWAGEAADELVELELELEAQAPRIVLEYRLAEATRLLREYAASIEAQLLGQETYDAGLRARRELVEKRERELEAAGAESAIEVARMTLRRSLTGAELTIPERRRLLDVVLDGVEVRRTPRRGAAASERARLVFATAAEGTLEHDAAELVEQTAA